MARYGGPKIPLNSPYYPKEKKPLRIRATAISYREKVVRIVGRYGKDYLEIEKYFLERHMKRHTVILSPDSSYYPYMIIGRQKKYGRCHNSLSRQENGELTIFKNFIAY